MSSRSQDSQRLADLATQITDVAAGCVKMVGVLSQVNTELADLSREVTDISNAIDELDKRLITLERSS